jgi:hypothetical protein
VPHEATFDEEGCNFLGKKGIALGFVRDQMSQCCRQIGEVEPSLDDLGCLRRGERFER